MRQKWQDVQQKKGVCEQRVNWRWRLVIAVGKSSDMRGRLHLSASRKAISKEVGKRFAAVFCFFF